MYDVNGSPSFCRGTHKQHTSLKLQAFPIIRRRHPRLLFKETAEVEGVVISYDGGHLGDIIIQGCQKTPGVFDADGDNILHGGHAGILFETADKPGSASVHAGGILVNDNVRVVTLAEMADSRFHLILYIIGGLVAAAHLTADKDEQVTQVQG